MSSWTVTTTGTPCAATPEPAVVVRPYALDATGLPAMAGAGAPFQATGLATAGVRLRGPITTGTDLPAAGTEQHKRPSTTPGDLPPEDHLS